MVEDTDRDRRKETIAWPAHGFNETFPKSTDLTAITAEHIRRSDPQLEHVPHPDEPVFSRRDVERMKLENLHRFARILFPIDGQSSNLVAKSIEAPVVTQPVLREKGRTRWRLDFSFMGSFLKFRLKFDSKGKSEPID